MPREDDVMFLIGRIKITRRILFGFLFSRSRFRAYGFARGGKRALDAREEDGNAAAQSAGGNGPGAGDSSGHAQCHAG